MRYFIALEIPTESKVELEAAQQSLKQIIPQVRLTDNNKLHLTIAFIGEQSEELRDSLINVLAQASQDIKPFAVTPAYIDGFPTLHHPYTLWVGVKGDIDKLFVIRERVKDGLEKLNLPTDERRYIPHIAIAKTKDPFDLDPQQERQLEELMSQPFSSVKIGAIKLFESIPEGGLHTHNTLAEIKLV